MLTDELLSSRTWVEERRWAFKGALHINLLERAVVHSWIKELVLRGGNVLVTAIEDSRVAMMSSLKNRSSSPSILRSLQLSAPLLLAGNISIAMLFGPSKLNVADDPTRDADVRPACRPSPLWTEDSALVRWVGSLPSAIKPVARWGMLVLAIMSVEDLRALQNKQESGRLNYWYNPLLTQPPPPRRYWSPLPDEASCSAGYAALDFDQTLG